MRHRPVVAVSALLLLALGACSGEAAPADELSWEDSPLSKAFAQFYGTEENPEEWERQEAERQREVEEITATCMAEQGFEYLPVAQDQAVTYTEDEDVDTAEWAEQYGYGITTEPWADEQPAEPAEEWVDPNEDYVSSMSPSEQEAYFAALHGEPTFAEGDGEWVEGEDIAEEYSWEEAGCQGRAYHEVYEEDEDAAMMEDPAFTEFFAAAERLYEDAQRDPRVTEINAEWAECMADAGVSGMTTPDEASTALYEEYDRLYMEADSQVDWETIDWEALGETADPVREYMDEAGLDALREREIATAVADHACQEELQTQTRYLQVQFDLEETFVETYSAEIDALIATYGQES
ncbi:hypothetical protein [Georgenia sp. H159]|uniref:hypothetical protein n=1 Tax=Georgenia sp. H159 TaxID=3076115 RepID=UPI002D79094D|nr:hypothetical protein [Georgenia sp. H159]